MERAVEEIYYETAKRLLDTTRHILDRELKMFGLDAKIAVQLAQLDSWGKHYVAEGAARYIRISVDAQSLEKRLENRKVAAKRREIEDHFLKLKATQQMMNKLFGMHTNEFSWRRKLLGMEGQDSHRPQRCNAEAEREVWRVWHDHQALDEFSRYLKVAELTGQPMNKVWPAVKSYYENAPADQHD